MSTTNNKLNKFISIDNLSLFAELLKSMYATKSYVDEKNGNQPNLFIGTKDEYSLAKREGQIIPGTLVIILSDNESSAVNPDQPGDEGGTDTPVIPDTPVTPEPDPDEPDMSDAAILGTAILGVMKLG